MAKNKSFLMALFTATYFKSTVNIEQFLKLKLKLQSAIDGPLHTQNFSAKPKLRMDTIVY